MRKAILWLLLGCSQAAFAAAPPWLRDVARAPLPTYSDETKAVILLDEHTTTVKDNGEIVNTIRRAYKILRPAGREFGHVVVHFDNDTRLTFLKAWCIPASGNEYEVKEKDAVETGAFGELYSDNRIKVLAIPAADPGNVIGYEYEQKGRPTIYQQSFFFQDPLPVHLARFVLQLPANWAYSAAWSNYPSRDPKTVTENAWVWEMENVSALEPEPQMPAWPALGGRLVVNYYREGLPTHRSWEDIGAWYSNLTVGRRTATPAIQQKVAELTAGAPDLMAKVRALATFAQHDVRYVAIEIGIGGYQPHNASEIFTNHYGDCKDKATLLSTMLREIGLDSYYVLTHTERGVILPKVPAYTFNHVILAIRLPETENTSLPAVYRHPQLGRILLFDPTDRLTALGFLPSALQGNHGLLVLDKTGELITLPVPTPPVNRLERFGKLYLAPDGRLDGTMHETRTGSEAVDRRALLLDIPAAERTKTIERQLGQNMSGVTLRAIQVENLEDNNKDLIVRFQFVAERYAKSAGNLLLLRPRVLGRKGDDIMEGDKPRKFPVEFDTTSDQTDVFEISLPPGFAVDELPPPAKVEFPFAEYQSKTEVSGQVLRYTREFKIKDLIVPTDRLPELKQLYRAIAADERNNVVLKRQY